MKNSKRPFSFLRSSSHINILLHLLTILTVTSSAMKIFENVSLSTVEILKNNGYAVEVHNVETQDGYILELHRIPRSKCGQKPTRNHPVFIHHGVLGSSADWVLGGADISLPMKLADDGYDVWMANSRGNTYSRKHVSLNVKQKAFWTFSLNEVGKYDLPASIDYILKNTSTLQLHYIGWSMGSCVFFIMGSERPEYQPKIRSQISLAPVAFLSNTRSSLRFIAPYAKAINFVVQKTSKGAFLPSMKFQSFLANTVCREKMTQKWICEKSIIFSSCGSDPINFNSNLIPLIMGHIPAGTSSMLVTHFAQLILKDTFGQYDYGYAKNMQHYNSTQPPSYNLKSIQVPITLIYGENDILADTEDVMRLKAQLPKLMDVIAVNDSYFNHVDFMWSRRVNELINDPIKGILQKTDDSDWQYSGPSSSVEDNEIVGGTQKPRPVDPKFEPGLEFFLNNLEAIVAYTMPRKVDAKDTAEFEQELDMQKTLFRDVILWFKMAGNVNEWMRNGFNDVQELTDDVATEVTGTINVVETHAKQTTTLVISQVESAGRSVSDGVTNAKSAVAGGLTDAVNVVMTHAKHTTTLVNSQVADAGRSLSDGVANAKSAVAGGLTDAVNVVKTHAKHITTRANSQVASAGRSVTDGVANTKNAMADGMAKAENFVLHGLSDADRAVSNAFQTISKTLRLMK